MSKEIFKGNLFTVMVEVNDERLARMKAAPEATAKALTVAADYWTTGILPEHFKSGAAARYGYAARSKNYLRQKGGRPPLVFSGSLRNDLPGRRSFQLRGSHGLAMKMWARVLNFAPSTLENSADLYVKHRGNRRGYPNLKREIKITLPEEAEAMARVVTTQLELAFGPTKESASPKLAG